ncbi:MBL fold metallo-hydrolase [Streptosporangium sp. NPDC002544]|uniref:MBL fold metallo-hydrolase n=1 Tax=Streptosporangium sp. NPDC002544 TaxID=3154538 RepID=UPI00333360C1
MPPSLEWTEPGAFEVARNVYRIPLPMPSDSLHAVNVYVLYSDDGLVLIDGGWAVPEGRNALIKALAHLGASPHDIHRFLVTHVHRDHYTQAVAMRREFGAGVGLGHGERATLELMRQPDRSPLTNQIATLPELGAPELARRLGATQGERRDVTEWETPDEWLEEGPIPLFADRVLHAVSTPGHTAGHLVFHDLENRLLFAGDHVLPAITPSIGLEASLSGNPLGAFLNSLAVVRSRPDAMLLAAHGPVAPSAHARVDELIAHHDERLDEIHRLADSGAGSPGEIAQAMRWTRRGLRLTELAPFSGMMAVFETTAHLELLVAQGRLSMSMRDGVRHYR